MTSPVTDQTYHVTVISISNLMPIINLTVFKLEFGFTCLISGKWMRILPLLDLIWS